MASESSGIAADEIRGQKQIGFSRFRVLSRHKNQQNLTCSSTASEQVLPEDLEVFVVVVHHPSEQPYQSATARSCQNHILSATADGMADYLRTALLLEEKAATLPRNSRRRAHLFGLAKAARQIASQDDATKEDMEPSADMPAAERK